MRKEKYLSLPQSGWVVASVFALVGLFSLPVVGSAQLSGVENGNWTYLGGDAGHARYTIGDEITASNFGDLEVAWIWDNASFGASTHGNTATPSSASSRSPFGGDLVPACARAVCVAQSSVAQGCAAQGPWHKVL